MAFSFEKFTAVGKRFAPVVSIRTNGTLGLSQGALHKASITVGAWFVVLYYDAANKALGIRFTKNPEEEGAMRLNLRAIPAGSPGAGSLTAFVAAKSFLNYYGISHSTTQSFNANWDEVEGMLITVLSKPDKDEPATME